MGTAVYTDMPNGYVNAARAIMTGGALCSPRGQRTRELLAAQFTLLDPYASLPIGINRRVSTPFAACEAIQLVGGVSDYEFTVRINRNMKQFADKHATTGEPYFHGAYGPRTGPHMPELVRRLQADPDSRQAVVNIYSATRDLHAHRKDIPCTSTLQFLVREGRVYMSVYMRSNDIWWGTAYDVFQFTQLQFTVANVLGLEVGHYTHTAGSFHAYERDWDSIDALHRPDKPYPKDYPRGFTGGSWEEAAERARIIMQRGEPLTESEEWYWRQLHDR